MSHPHPNQPLKDDNLIADDLINTDVVESVSDSELIQGRGGSFNSWFTDVVLDIADVLLPGFGSLADPRSKAKAEQDKIAERAGDTSIGGVLARTFLPTTVAEAQTKYANKIRKEAQDFADEVKFTTPDI